MIQYTLIEKIYERDYFWNFRDAAKFNVLFAKGLIYRTTSLTNYQHESFFLDFLKTYNINQIIDLRADREVAENNYTEQSQQNFKYVHAPFDPWAQSIAFQNTYNTGTNAEIAYHFFMMECKPSIKIVLESIIQNDHATALHCHAGKDRTGIIIALLNVLIDTPKQDILTDYLASEMDSHEGLMDIVFAEIEKFGGIEGYLLSCQLSLQQIEKLKKTILICQ